jgi:O-methyltransferase
MILKPSINFIQRMIVDSPTMESTRKKFFAKEYISFEELVTASTTFPEYNWTNTCWGPDTMTMVSWIGIELSRYCIEDTIINGIEGDFIETGAWKGGLCVLAKYMFDYYKVDKKVFVADSFEGLPKPDIEKYPQDTGDKHYLIPFLSVPIETVKENFRKFDLLDDNVIFLKGWFKNTLPTAPIDKLSILRMDGDMFESTFDALNNLYPKLSVGGYCIVDDMDHVGCYLACMDYRNTHGITEQMFRVSEGDQTSFWQKEREINE